VPRELTFRVWAVPSVPIAVVEPVLLSTTIRVAQDLLESKFGTAGIAIATDRAPEASTTLEETEGGAIVARSVAALLAGVGAGAVEATVATTGFDITVSVFVNVSRITVLTVTF
jgi:hypothetical protein